MSIEEALRDLSEALAGGNGAPSRDTRLQVAREVVARHCLAALAIERPGAVSIAEVLRLAVETSDKSARRAGAVLLVHALPVRGLVPMPSAGNLCALMEVALRDVLLRDGYPFGGTVAERIAVLERLHRNIGELMQPWEPTFPNWQGLYAG
jgi:hypothetical protein